MLTTQSSPTGTSQSSARFDEIVRLVGVSKRFGATMALDDVSFDLRRGECHVLFGENGAGKSTLIQILAGVHKPTKGTIYYNDAPTEILSVHHARTLGISAVFQEFSIAPDLTVAENLFLGSEPKAGFLINRRKARQDGQQLLDKFGFNIGLDRMAGDLSRAEMQMLEIARAFRTPPSVLILDEPTASLTDAEATRLFALVERLKQEGVGIVYITHRMHEIKQIGDRVTVLRDGHFIATLPIADASVERLITLMTGRPQTELFPKIAHQPGETLLEFKGVTTLDRKVRNVSLTARAGEVVGIAGLVGSGKGDIGPAALGTSSLLSGEIVVNGVDAGRAGAKKTLDLGLCYVPSDRRAEGLFLEHDICTNITIASLRDPKLRPGGFLRRSREMELSSGLVDRLSVRPAALDQEVSRLSGGNQQKVMIGRFIARNASVYIFDEPTVGVDVGARLAIYEQIRTLCESGAAVLLISSDLPEILHLTHRAYVMHQGRIVGECASRDYSEKHLLHLMFGESSASPAPNGLETSHDQQH